ncbi:hypothetical protein O6H91_12G072600 [Diphasiastrum complanatum]|uniref:Uncharacterized protein n=2 Tax=Diphasiastrum complanatum TaxID=34168 RepID=A0ACC2C397_DIPCM|nr:hypothetical protein O6H91_12G072600 [Diphasiastrum complanatum]KAJ7536518.1 hypothetical protein O6H91_12G072600 [Diphasiastrum complanatum]
MKISMTFSSIGLILCVLLFLVDNGGSLLQENSNVHRHRARNPFILSEPLRLVKTEAGTVEIISGEQEDLLQVHQIGLNFVTLEPQALLLPQYIDTSCVLYVQQGKVRLGWVRDDGLSQQDMETGDVMIIPGGNVFYLFNTDVAQRLRIFGLFDTSESLDKRGRFQSFYVAGGFDPPTVLSGFDSDVLAAALKVSREEVTEILSAQSKGPIVYTTRRQSEMMSRSLSSWSWMNIVRDYVPNMFQKAADYRPYNLLKKHRGFRNKNGWTIAVDGKEYRPLKKADAGVFAVSLKPGAVLAPHWNPRATEIAVVTNGTGTIQISYPNGSSALDQRVDVGTIFVVPRYYPMCQIASRDGPFEFVGFSTSSRPNQPQFLAGATSVLRALDDDTLAVAFDVPSDRLRTILDGQEDAVILPGFTEEPRAASKTKYDEKMSKMWREMFLSELYS